MHWRGEISFYGGVSFIGSRFTERLYIFFSLGEKSSQLREMEASLNRLWRNEVKGLFCSDRRREVVLRESFEMTGESLAFEF
jgi:hypothetical protein